MTEGLTAEQQFILSEWRKNYEECSDIVIYGTGINTSLILKNSNTDGIIGLLDGECCSGYFCGKRILTEAEAIIRAKCIVVVARKSVIGIIAHRIRYISEDHGIPVFDISGNNICTRKYEYGNEDLPYWNLSYDDLLHEINVHEVISFDIFDTLIMRDVLTPSDIFDIVQNAFSEVQDFKKSRLSAMRVLGDLASFDDIYSSMQKEAGFSDELKKELMNFEFMTEIEHIHARKVMQQAFLHAVSAGKTVYLLSDMYYSEKMLRKLLAKAGFDVPCPIFVSSEQKASKADGSLFRLLLQKEHGKTILHIGDNHISDGTVARKNGIDSFIIKSDYEILSSSGMQKILSSSYSFPQRLFIGNMTAHYFNDPFSLYRRKGYLKLNSLYEIGCWFLFPLFYTFAKWLDFCLVKSGIKTLILPARDGYLINKILDLCGAGEYRRHYILASRRALGLMALENREDIYELLKRSFKGSLKNLLKIRTGVDCNILEPWDGTMSQIEPYVDRILERASWNRKQYLQYLHSLSIDLDDSVATMDFVSSGTVQKYLQKYFTKSMTGYYFSYFDVSDSSHLGKEFIRSLMDSFGNYGKSSLFGDYFIMPESVLIDENTTFVGFSESGEFMFEDDGKAPEFQYMREVQKGVLDAAAHYDSSFQTYDKSMIVFAEAIFNCLFDHSIEISDDIKKSFSTKNSFLGENTCRTWN